MGFLREEKALKKLAFLLVPRWIKTLFFLITMLVSLLLFSAPILLIIADVLLSSALFSASLPLSHPSFTLKTLLVHLNSYDFRLSLIDIPLVSIARSAIILCKYIVYSYSHTVLRTWDKIKLINLSFLSIFQVFIVSATVRGCRGGRTWASPPSARRRRWCLCH